MATTRVKKAIVNLGNSRTEEEALVKAGFSPSYARSGQIKKTKGWQELLEKHIPDKKLTKVLEEGLSATKRQGVGGMAIGIKGGEVESMGHTEKEVPDYAVRHKYLETGLKLKGKMKDGETPTTINLIQITNRINQVLDGEST